MAKGLHRWDVIEHQVTGGKKTATGGPTEATNARPNNVEERRSRGEKGKKTLLNFRSLILGLRGTKRTDDGAKNSEKK